jgi:hypothetical protein
MGDAVRIAVGGIRERIIKAALVSWRDGRVIGLGCLLMVDTEHFYVLEDWVIDKTRGNGVTGWVSGCHSYQRAMIQGLESVVKYPISPIFLWHNVDSQFRRQQRLWTTNRR